MAPAASFATGLKAVAIAAACWGENRIDLFRVGSSSELSHKWWDGSVWGGWENLGGILTTVPSVTAWGENRLDVMVTGTDSGAWHYVCTPLVYYVLMLP
jgi:hypothetical protein